MNLPVQVLRGKTVFTSGILANLITPVHENHHAFYDEADFRHRLLIERMRTQRYKKPFLLLMVDISKLPVTREQEEILDRVKAALLCAVREIDTLGWFHNRHTIGIIFTEVVSQQSPFIECILHKIYHHLHQTLHPDLVNQIEIAFHLFPKVNSGSMNMERDSGARP